jgi:pyruvate kinase
MIARGDLAVECGYTLLAELQEDILQISEAAHVPVIWATQVLETLTKKGTPTRAEITDAAMAARAECIMLNKGPYINKAVQVLDEILTRVKGHSSLKRLTVKDFL